MLRASPLGLALVLSLASSAPSFAHGVKTRTLEMIHPYTLDSPPGATTASIYMTIESRSTKGDRLTAAVTSWAASVELREPAAGEAGTNTRPVPSVEIKAKGRIDLTRSGPHLVLSGLTRPLAAWDTFPLTLIFERAGRIEVEVLVEERITPPEPPKR